MAKQREGEAPKTSIFSKFLAKPLSYFIFILWTLITVAPLLWMGYSSFKTNEELTKDIYSLPHDLFHVRDGYLDVVEPQTNIKYPNGMLEKLGIVNAAGKGDTKNRTAINENILILESPNIGAHKRIKVHFIVRDSIPADLKTSDGRILRDIQPGEGVQVKVSDFPALIQAKINWQTIWWNYTSAWSRGELGMKFVNSII